MQTLQISDQAANNINALAQQEHITCGEFVERLIEDYQDARMAEKAIEEINNGESKVLSLSEARQLYNDLAG